MIAHQRRAESTLLSSPFSSPLFFLFSLLGIIFNFSSYVKNLCGSGGCGTERGSPSRSKILVRGFPVEGLVRSHATMEVLVAGQRVAGDGDREVAVVEGPELDAGAVVGPLHTTVPLWPAGRQHVGA